MWFSLSRRRIYFCCISNSPQSVASPFLSLYRMSRIKLPMCAVISLKANSPQRVWKMEGKSVGLLLQALQVSIAWLQCHWACSHLVTTGSCLPFFFPLIFFHFYMDYYRYLVYHTVSIACNFLHCSLVYQNYYLI